jgi:hypothetical protein
MQRKVEQNECGDRLKSLQPFCFLRKYHGGIWTACNNGHKQGEINSWFAKRGTYI